ncbi:S49 family peptidase [Pseudahrensia aquimaris]|uniref:S49 family peptidase n=1 Tax=Pseudahrensia aquimaris TaxID=744461 RepID=A0ABW3FC03_9HYPH
MMPGKSVTIPVVRMNGMIAAGGSSLRPTLSMAGVAEPLERAFSVKKAPAVAIVVNSPGGSPVQSRLIYKRIRDLAKEKGKKVHVFVEDVAASGGYMIACAGDDITVDPSSIVGSIGVISSSFGFVEAIDKLGVERRVYTAGQNKSVLDPFLPAKKADIDRLKQLQLEIHAVFIDLVRDSRGSKLQEDDTLFTGAFWTGMAGKKLGLVDEIGDIRSTLRQRYGDKVELQVMEVKKGLFGRRSGNGIMLDKESLVTAAVDRVAELAEEKALWARYGL